GRASSLDMSCLCFGAGDSTSVEGQNINLPSAWERREQAGRAAHLALHRAAPPFPPSRTSCEVRVERAIQREVEAHLLEFDVRRVLGVTGFRYPFERDLDTMAREQRAEWLREYFLSHPEGEHGVPGFVSQYRKRCKDTRVVAERVEED
ncbi:MAG TPA: hypothetical protein VFQ61_30225, partial [Polyangiaceae bacterium]|nr:hypothetical protein [Polyangiaceae bacterium]